MAKTKLGVGTCPICAEGIVWKVSDSGSLSYTCQHCDFRGYAPAHSDAAKAIGAKVAGPAPVKQKLEPKAAPKAKPMPEPKAAPAPAPKANPAGIWDHLTQKAGA